MGAGRITEDEIIHIKRNPWADNFFRPLLITIMIMSLNISVVNLVQLINPAWRGVYFLTGMLIATVEAIYSYRVLKHYRSRGISLMRYRVAEAAVLVLVLKLLSFMDKPLPYIGAELQAIWQTPMAFFNIEFYVLLILALLTWFAAHNTIADFEALYDPYSDNTVPLDNLATRFFWGGGILLLISGITQWVALSGVSSLIDWRRPALSGVILNVLVYFVLGLVLLSQVNLTTLTVRWRVQKITMAKGLVKQWAKYGLIFLGLVALIAFLLPTRYSLGFLATAGVAIKFLIELLIFILQLIILLIMLPFSWLLSLLGATPLDRRAAPPPAPPPIVDAPAGTSAPWLEILRSLIFWLVALVAIGYLVKSYLDDHPELIQQLKNFKFISLIFSLLSRLWGQLMGWAQVGLEMIPKKIKRAKPGSDTASITQSWNWFGLRKLAPRERILHYYLNILKRAQKKGLARQEHQTPYEYEPNLAQSAPRVQTEIHVLTDAFVHARYSQERFSEEQAVLVKVLWQRVRRELRNLSRGQAPGAKERGSSDF